MSSLSPETTQPELSGLGVTPASGVWPASGIWIASGVVAGISAVSVASGAISVVSGAISVVSGSITINSGQVAISGLFAGQSGGTAFLSGAAAFSGAIPVIPLVWDFSGKQWTQTCTNISGSTIQSVYVASGTVAGVTATTTISGLFAGQSGTTKMLSGASAFSGAIPVIPLQWDYSGSQWAPFVTAISGSAVQTVWVASGNIIGGVTVSGMVGISGNVAVISGAISVVSGSITINSGQVAVSGLTSLVSGANTQTTAVIIAPKYKSATYSMSGLFSTAASSLTIIAQLLSSGVCDTVTIRNWSGNTPIFVDTGVASGTTLGAGGGFVLYGGDGITLDYGPNMNTVAVAAQVSGTLISHFASYY